jgi:hypothetical protein
MANLLDDLFQWAAQQPAANITSVNLAMTGNEIGSGKDSCLVSYATGRLSYKPPSHSGLFHAPASFNSEADGIKQYFSNRTYGGQLGSFPFSSEPKDIDLIDISIGLQAFTTIYGLTIHSSALNLRFTVNVSFDVTTGVIYATTGPVFITVSLCGRDSHPLAK